ncbi:MAG TPA: glycoside hydrolase family 71/99-like protein [Aggregatilinea sp.]|uniref:glycoside hydrolase family 71/99-like protein n=1 Tax=Aggregatilinea sp. TaxID=2806333 RepID=UPI002D07F435|nr:glycoside hydrolase family 71/99-like protein [Aggregatilinea sp.]HML23750.1 glycoside hydrolase family 71/99-like protein [Aggregatilinea sp.]
MTSEWMLSRRTLIRSAGLLAGGLLSGAISFDPARAQSGEAEGSARPLLMAHYMPWYMSRAKRGNWGWHWTMDHFNPSETDENGRPQIASHFMPLTGPYDSGDPIVLEYQTLLMKASGIDGVIVDWYGIEDFRDYGDLNKNTGALFDAVKNAGLKFAVCYEDRTVKYMVEAGHFTDEEALAHGQDVMRYLQEQWFTDDSYLKYNGQPVLLTFGPQYFKSSTAWETLRATIDPAPGLVTLDGHRVMDELASYPWPPMAGGVTLNRAAIEAYLTQFYRKAARSEYMVGGAFPGFYDIYAEAGVQASYGYLDAEDGETFRYTLQLALDQNPDVIQLITWNDYGEGTNIEPAEEYGYRYLETVQDVRRALPGGEDFPYSADDLRLPFEIYTLRKDNYGDEAVNADLDAAASAILAGDAPTAAEILGGLEA